ncbi:hypothetical protein V476_02835 [Pseudomonas syringae KCTC 12500]|uniref:ATP-binding protein n=2 Tax=Pseudomonas syringae TaxID=317 RepID=UPI000419AE6F|nr:ATP-binding protein [Pseudomonas syringae]KMY00139.1 hypothetical protein V476_02835 [Pseudomonas syringae KCTC 12500]POR83153.1 hypothetical protein BKM21_24335 [Pseudomonas syringae pv. syringae]
MATQTIQQLATITDAAQFERIATSVLRSADPDLYANLSHQGVNTNGKTVKAPLDNLGWVTIDGESMFVAGAHTTSSRDDLERKWLHNPSTVKPRKQNGKPTQPPGDLVKALAEIVNLRKQHPNLRATLALTCNREEPTVVRLKAQALASDYNVTLDVWSVSRIAQYLDTTSEGQAIRRAYLGVQPNLLSMGELLRIGRLSLNARLPATNRDALVSREQSFAGAGHLLLAGASGMGKTTICFEILHQALVEGQPGIVLSDQTVRAAGSIEEAIDIELRRYLPELEPLAGFKALELSSELKPFVVVVEDISRAENTVSLMNKLVAWALRGSSQSDSHPLRKWRLLCPIWPKFLAGLESKEELTNGGMVHVVGLYSTEEALEAVRLRGLVLGYPQNDLSAAAVARELGHDPLLIGLYDFAHSARAQDVIAQYVSRELDNVALSSELTATDLENAVNALLSGMLHQRCLVPTWREAQAWLNSYDLSALRYLVAKGGVLRLSKAGGSEVIELRHGRILHTLLANFIATQINADHQAAYLSDPYFAEFVGTAASLTALDPNRLYALMSESPLVAFHAFKNSVQRKSDYTAHTASVIDAWINMAATRTNAYYSRRARGLQILSEIDSPDVLDLTYMFPQDDFNPYMYEAQFRNGNLSAGLNWVSSYSFGVNVNDRDKLVEHVRNKYGRGLERAIEKVLVDPESSIFNTKSSALYLAGYLAEPRLSAAVRTAWRQLDPEERDLEAFLWAAAHTCGDEVATTLGPVCDAWEALPEREDSVFGKTNRTSLAAHGISWKFRDHVPRAALPYFVLRAKQSEALEWPITYMLRGVDDPIALQHGVEYVAGRTRESAGTGGYVDHFLKDEWRRQTEKDGRVMSIESKQHLANLAMNLDNDPYLRKSSFSLWEVCVAPGDLDIARNVKVGDVLHDPAVWARARRADFSVIPELLKKIEEDPSYWWQAGRYIWTVELTAALDASLHALEESTLEEDENGLWMFPELVLQLDSVTAERLVLNSWSKIQCIPEFVHVALCLATPKLVNLANMAIAEAADPHKLLEHFPFTAGLFMSNRPVLTRSAQLDALRPHLSLLSESDIFVLWETCNKNNWLQFRKQNLDPILFALRSPKSTALLNREAVDMSDIEEALAGKRFWHGQWIEKQARNGVEREKIFPALLQWVKSKGTEEALSIVDPIFSSEANRTQFAQLKEISAFIEGRDSILDKIRFEVFHRTLR